MDVGITAIGCAHPKTVLSQAEAPLFLLKVMDLDAKAVRRFKAICQASGIDQRYSVVSDYDKSPGQFEFFPNQVSDPFPSTSLRMQYYKAHALRLALLAIDNCLVGFVHFNKASITHLITVSCTGMYAPGLDVEIVQQYGLNTTVKRTAINFMGCYGAFNAMKLASSICVAESDAVVLIVSVELCTLHVQKKNDLDVLYANALFADGAAAALVQGLKADAPGLVFQHFYNDLLPQTNQEMAWRIGDQGFDMVLSAYVPQAIQNGIADCVQRLLSLNTEGVTSIDLYAIHPGGLKILQAFEAALGLQKEQNHYAYQVLQQYGNMSSATILFVLKALLADMTAAQHHQTVFSCAFGPGLTLESMLLRVYSKLERMPLEAQADVLTIQM